MWCGTALREVVQRGNAATGPTQVRMWAATRLYEHVKRSIPLGKPGLTYIECMPLLVPLLQIWYHHHSHSVLPWYWRRLVEDMEDSWRAGGSGMLWYQSFAKWTLDGTAKWCCNSKGTASTYLSLSCLPWQKGLIWGAPRWTWTLGNGYLASWILLQTLPVRTLGRGLFLQLKCHELEARITWLLQKSKLCLKLLL